MSVVKPQYGPTLIALVGGLPRAARIATIAVGVLLVAGALTIAVRTRPDETTVIVRGPETFNLIYPSQLQRVTQPGALLALRREHADGLFLDSYVVRALSLPAYRGAVGGLLPVYADGYLKRMRRRYASARLKLEGRTRINNAIGYQLVLQAKRGRRTLYVRHLLLVPEEPEGARRGVVIEVESTPAAGTPNAIGNGDAGPLKTALRSFRFGTSRTGGEQ
ncbi:MAG: hypothetical protein WKF48_03485 [Solirubrobacteraceae bacterium]